MDKLVKLIWIISFIGLLIIILMPFVIDSDIENKPIPTKEEMQKVFEENGFPIIIFDENGRAIKSGWIK
jgi:hypothetical protein